jgi:opacity protein-like surface antigen
MSLKKALLAATMLALPLAAQAQPVNGLYVGAGAGLNFLQESDVELSRQFGGTNAQRNGSAEFNLGWAGVISLGYGFGNGVRAELEGSYRENEVDDITGFANQFRVPGRRVDGTARSYGIMANALYDFDLGPGSFVMPYIGVGAGYVWHEYDGTRIAAPGVGNVTIDGSDGRFAYQAIAGAAFPIRAVPGRAITAE